MSQIPERSRSIFNYFYIFFDREKRAWEDNNRRLKQEMASVQEQIDQNRNGAETKQVELTHLTQTKNKLDGDRQSLQFEEKGRSMDLSK